MIDARQRRILFPTTAIAASGARRGAERARRAARRMSRETTCSPLPETSCTASGAYSPTAPIPVDSPQHRRPLRFRWRLYRRLRRGQRHGERRQQLLWGLERGRGLADQFAGAGDDHDVGRQFLRILRQRWRGDHGRGGRDVGPREHYHDRQRLDRGVRVRRRVDNHDRRPFDRHQWARRSRRGGGLRRQRRSQWRERNDARRRLVRGGRALPARQFP